jgi:pyruvate/2-oxoglutarate dehydrogenase complex dihydrolipoamide dehydrogenase (E3) component
MSSPAPAKPASPVRVEPFDQYNQQLVGQVHPPDWTNPRPKERYHLVVIGAGTAGLVTASIAAGLGARVALIERHLMGGDCLNVGCVPSKSVIAAARSWQAAADSSRQFAGPRTVGTGGFREVMERMRRLRAGLARIDGAARFRDLGVDVFLGAGRFTGPDTVVVDDALLHFRRAVIATGARPAASQIPGLERVGYLTNETLFSLTELPGRLLVIGAGPVGCEMAQAFARLGARVTVLNRTTRILPREDEDAARIVERAMEGHGVRFLHQATVIRAETRDGSRLVQVQCNGRMEDLPGDQILLAVGRTPNVEGLGLEAAGVKFDRRGVAVDDRFRTTSRRIYAIGDVSSKYQFTHSSDAQARRVVGNALFRGIGGGRASDLVMPWTTYTSPEIAHVGMYQQEAAEVGYKVDTITMPLREVDRAVLDGQEDGFFRVHLRSGSDEILGATLVAEHAGEMIGEITLAITSGTGLRKIGATIHTYPTQAEVFRKAADAWQRRRLTPAAKRALGWFFRVVFT